jgi:hypothetical protein
VPDRGLASVEDALEIDSEDPLEFSSVHSATSLLWGTPAMLPDDVDPPVLRSREVDEASTSARWVTSVRRTVGGHLRRP